MATTGINKRLQERRKELDYSVLEACIRLDISKRKLYLIEHGYIKVKNPVLRARFIRKYQLPENFFEDDFLGYPTPIEDEVKEIKLSKKFLKIIDSIWTKIVLFLLMGGFITMASIGVSMNPKIFKETETFFSERFNMARDYARENGEEHGIIDPLIPAQTPILCGSSYHALPLYNPIPDIFDEKVVNFFYTSINFLDNNERQPMTFYKAFSYFDLDKVIDLGLGITVECDYEVRFVGNAPRVQFYAYYYDEDAGIFQTTTPLCHISADYNLDKERFQYNLVEVMNIYSLRGELQIPEENSLEYFIVTTMFENQYSKMHEAITDLFAYYQSALGMTYEEFNLDLIDGVKKYNSYSSLVTNLTLWGLVMGVVMLALLTFLVIRTILTKRSSSLLSTEEVSQDITLGSKSRERAFKELPKNRWPTPFIPEMVIRILVIIVSLISSLGVFYIFDAIQGLDPVGLIEQLSFKAEFASLSTLSMILLFFTKLDIRQNKKNNFLANYILFFVGIIFYFAILLISFTLGNSTTEIAKAAKIALDYLPGNIVWGILSFNLLSSFLFDDITFERNEKRNRIIYRCLAIIPVAYMVVSSLYQIGKKAWGWQWPLWASSLLFSKALILTAFSILYCLGVFLYRYLTTRKYGPDNAKVYQNGNRYIFIKNLIVCGILALLAIIDVIILKTAGYDNYIGAGGNYVIIYAIPFIIFYRPHMGKRNPKWDLAFMVLYMLSMTIGILMIANNLSIYITSL